MQCIALFGLPILQANQRFEKNSHPRTLPQFTITKQNQNGNEET